MAGILAGTLLAARFRLRWPFFSGPQGPAPRLRHTSLKISTMKTQTNTSKPQCKSFELRRVPGCCESVLRRITALAGAGLLLTPFLCSGSIAPPLNLGAASTYTVFSLTGATDNVGGSSTVVGDVAVGNNGTLNVQGTSTITGTAFVGTGATVIVGGGSTIGAGQTPRDLTQANTDAHNSASTFAALSADQTISGNLTSSQIFNPVAGQIKVVDITGNVNVGGSGTLTFNGTANDFYIINVGGSFMLGGTASILLSGGILPQNLVFNIASANSTAALQLASGTHSIGTFLVANGGANMHGGNAANPVLTGAVVANNIQIQSTAYILGVPTIPEPSTVMAGALLLLPLAASTLKVLRKSTRNSGETRINANFSHRERRECGSLDCGDMSPL